jgi:hypothetical protein
MMLPLRSRIPRAAACAALLLAALLAGCGGSGGSGGGASSPNAKPAPASPQIESAQSPAAGDFPRADGRTLQQIADKLQAGPQVGLATSVYTPGTNRLAFGVIDAAGAFVYGKTAVFVASSPTKPAQGPFLAPADSLQVRPAFRSRTSAADTGDVQAIYHTDVRLPRVGPWYVLTVTKVGSKLLGGTAQLKVTQTSPIPAVGDRAPRIDTPTLASVGRQVSKIDTRDPPDQMHEVSLKDVLGRKPVALLFATPALCQSRVCGPVTDIAAQLQAAYGDRVDFIHNEVYVENDPNKGLRPQLQAFHLTTEPWLFTIDRQGRIAARLQGAFGIEEFKQAVEAALR